MVLTDKEFSDVRDTVEDIINYVTGAKIFARNLHNPKPETDRLVRRHGPMRNKIKI